MAERLHGAGQALIDGLQSAERRMVEQTRDLSAAERAGGYRALVRALMNQLGRFEVDRANPELVPYNGWREKFFMDNPDFLYWVADIDDGYRYRLRGQVGDAKHTSITAYTPPAFRGAALSRGRSSSIWPSTASIATGVITTRPRSSAWIPTS